MGEKGYESRFVCKLCNKKYPCGKSLGGHMRSHVVANSSAEFQEKDKFNLKKSSSFVEDETKLGESGYGLRENPKKTWRAEVPLAADQVCKQCGKGFHSLKALCGHMACHSEKDKGMKDDHSCSWSNENDEKMVFDSQSDTESEEIKLRSKTKKFAAAAAADNDDSPPFSVPNHGSSSISEIDFGQEPEDVAMCLILMSRDVSRNNYGVDSVVESSDNNSVVIETKSSSIDRRLIGRKKRLNEPKEATLGAVNEKMENSDSGYFLDECGGKAESDASDGEIRKSSIVFKSSRNQYDDDGTASRKRKYGNDHHESARMMKNGGGEMWSKSEKKSKYECFNCKKIFKSYQALGGHRPCHKRLNESRDESGENNPDDDSSIYHKKPSAKKTEKNSSPKKNKEQVCPFCNRVFKNGQALGGHKRSHFIGGHDDNANRSPEAKPELPDLLDLNLPAPEANEDD